MADALLLANQVRTYAWGSHTVLPGLLGQAVPSVEPWAEIWIGAHPADPSQLPDGRSLAEVEPDLPFMVKLLAADVPLSIQAHPDRARAVAGFAAEDDAAVPRESGARSFKDHNHKPELLVAITPAQALCGFRDPAEILTLAGSWGSPRWSDIVADLADAGDVDSPARLRAVFARLVTLTGAALAQLLQEVVAAATTLAPAAGSGAQPAAPQVEQSAAQWAAQWVLRLAELHPHDPGVVAPLLLRLVALQPGEGLFVAAGVLHSYLHGAGVEFQASSDNVLRAGLTSKKIDLPELLQVIVGDHGRQPIVHPRSLAAGLDAYDVPVQDFAVWRVSPGAAPVQVPAKGPVLAVCVAGAVTFSGTGLTPGRAAYLPGGGDAVTVAGPGVCFVTAAGPQPT